MWEYLNQKKYMKEKIIKVRDKDYKVKYDYPYMYILDILSNDCIYRERNTNSMALDYEYEERADVFVSMALFGEYPHEYTKSESIPNKDVTTPNRKQ